MRRIEDEAARMGVLVEDLLTLARLDEVRDAPHGAGRPRRAGPRRGRRRAVTAPDREITLHAEPAAVTGDADQLRQVLVNLLRNALVHTPAGTPIEVSVGARTAPCGSTCATTGPACRARIQRAVRALLAHGGRPRARQGRRRAGLAIVAGIVDAHGGTGPRRERPGGGAEFQVRLPARNSTRLRPRRTSLDR